MDIVENNLENFPNKPFDREQAKNTASKILSSIIPSKMTLSEASRLTNNDPGNLKRAKDGETLLNAKAFTMILKKSYILRSTNEVAHLIDGCPHLHNYLVKELGEEYTNPNYSSDTQSIKLVSAIDDNITRQIYAILFSKKKVTTSVITQLFGEKEGFAAIKKLENNNVAIYHSSIGIVELKEIEPSTNIAFNKKNLSLISETISQDSLRQKDALYGWDSVFLTDAQEKEFYDMLKDLREKIVKKIKEFEQVPIENRTILADYSLVYSKSLDLSLGNQETIQ